MKPAQVVYFCSAAPVYFSNALDTLADIIASAMGTVQNWIHDPAGRDDITLVLLRKL